MIRSLPVALLVALLLGGCASTTGPLALGVEPLGQGAPAGPAWPSGAALAALAGDDDEADDDGDEADDEDRSVIAGILLYLPNRILDVFDIVRARVRLGPGLAFGARATELADVYIGTYFSVYAGLPGPRGRRLPRLPVGVESKSGVEASVADVTAEGPIGPDYGAFEVGLGGQLLLVGLDVGVEPFEIVDLVAGLLTFDPADDDF